MFTITGIGLVVGIFLMWGLGRGITRPLKAVIAGLTNGSEQVASASEQVSQSSQSLAEGSSEQAASLEETSSSLEEMASMTKQNAANAEESASASEEMNSQAGHMKTFVKGLVTLVGSSSNDHTFNKGHGTNTKKASGIAKNKIVSSIAAERPI
jgi:methyl-accepting chemotaxis protein